jgi:hypothetical protein
MIDPKLEWLDTNGLGGFAMGTASGERTRRYHSLLMTDRKQQRSVFVSGIEVWAQTPRVLFRCRRRSTTTATAFLMREASSQSLIITRGHTGGLNLPDGTKISQEILLPYRQGGRAWFAGH